METKSKIPALRFKGFTDAWEEHKFDECFNFPVSTNSLSRALLNYDEGDIKSVHYGDILIKYPAILNIKNDKIPYITGGKLEKYKSSLLENGDLIFADAAEDETVGKAVEVNGLTEENLVAGLHTIVARPKDKKAEFFLGYYINSNTYHRQLLRLIQGSKVSSISKGNLQKTLVSFPKDFEEQRKIGSFFKQLDETIALHQRKLDLLKEQKKGFLQKMFPKNGEKVPELRFAGFADDWEQRKAGDIFKNVSDKGYSDLPVLSASQELGMIRRDEIGIDIKYDEASTKNYKRVQPGQFVIHLRSFQGGFAWSDIEGITSPAYTVLDYKEPNRYNSDFWKVVLTSPTFITRLETVTYGIRDGRSISYTDFSSLKLTAPSLAEQQQIGAFFAHLDTLISLHQRKLDLLKELKKALLRQLFV